MKLGNKDIHIIGGGPAGMALAHYANKNNISFSLFEKNKVVGGNCKTIQSGDFLFDTGAHRLHDKNPEVTKEIKILMGSELTKVSSPSKIFYNGKMINFPISIIDLIKKIDLKVSLKIIKDNIFFNFKDTASINNFQDFAFSTYGKTLSNLFLTNYSEKLWGENAKNLSSDISGGRLKNLNLITIIKQLVLNKERQSKHLDGDFLYPQYGFGTIFTSIYDSLNKDDVFLQSNITEILVKDNIVDSIIINDDEKINVNKVISTLPLPLLIRKINCEIPDEINTIINSINYRSVKLFVLFLNKNSFSNNASIYFPQKNIPFTRIYEPKNRSLYMAPKNQTCIVIELPYNHNEPSENHNVEEIKLALIDNNLIVEEDILNYQIIDMPYAYPVLNINTKNKIEKLCNYLRKFKNLSLIGRSAQFKYLHIHDLFKKAEYMINKKLTD